LVKTILKRDVLLVDNSGPNESGLSINMVLWGNSAERFTFTEDDVIVIRNARVTNFNGKSVAASANTQFYVDESLQETKILREWVRKKHPINFIQVNHYPIMSVAEARELLEKDVNRIVYFQTIGTVVNLKHDQLAPLYYNACCNPECLKKVVYEAKTNMWICEKCNQSHAKPNIRYILSIIIADYSGSLWANIFNEVSETIVGRSAASIQALKSENEAAISIIFQSAISKSFVMKMKLYNSFFQDDYQMRTNILHLEDIDFVKESSWLLEQISEY